MARYIDAELLDPEDFENCTAYLASEIIESVPTANVVSKREAESIFDELMKEAREIADSYEKLANETSDYDCARIECKGCQMGALLVLFKIAKLKKKYTVEL